jgi:hypothetical protein
MPLDANPRKKFSSRACRPGRYFPAGTFPLRKLLSATPAYASGRLNQVNRKRKNSMNPKKAQKGPFLLIWAGVKTGKEVIVFLPLTDSQPQV